MTPFCQGDIAAGFRDFLDHLVHFPKPCRLICALWIGWLMIGEKGWLIMSPTPSVCHKLFQLLNRYSIASVLIKLTS
jgi:hypothetical protein